MNYLAPDSFDILLSIQFVTIVFVGGLGSLHGGDQRIHALAIEQHARMPVNNSVERAARRIGNNGSPGRVRLERRNTEILLAGEDEAPT